MKTSIKKISLMLLASLFVGIVFAAEKVVTIGSMKGTALPMYPQHNGAAAGTAVAGITFDYKLVTISGKSWAWTYLHGGGAIGATAWESQLRYYSSTYAKTENNLVNRVAGFTTSQTYGSTTSTIPAAPLKISFFQSPNGFTETDFIPYNVATANSPVNGDVTVPSISSCTSSGVTETAATINITGTDDSGDLFYYITGNGLTEVSFFPTITLSGLTPTTNYNLTVTPIDFSGNMGTPANVSFTTAGLVQVTSGVAQDIRFMLKSTTTTLEYYYEYVDPTKRFSDATIGLTPAGGTAFDLKPTISPDSTYCYGSTNDASLASKIVTVNFKYFTYKLPVDYAQWVITNSTITSGTLTGTPIKHQMGSGPSVSETEAVSPVINSATLVDPTSGYIKLNLSGSDNSGNVYYTITGAKTTVNAFRTGNYYLTSIDPGKVYNLTVKPYDLSGNTATAKTLTVKTMNARSNINDSITTNYNTIVLPTAPGGELVTIIKLDGSNLTIGCTTKSLLIPAGASRNRAFNNPTIVINGTTYPLTLDASNLTATVTFNGTIGTTSITNGTALSLRWSVFWGPAGTGGIPAGGNFFTGTFTYVIGDNGQTDVTGPSTPVLSLNGSTLSWPTCTDDLSGVKKYIVTETGQTPVTIFDLGSSSYNYTMVNSTNAVTVTAVDFVGNTTSKTKDVGTANANEQISVNTSIVYPNPATDKIYISGEVTVISLYSVQGQWIKSVNNTNSMDISTLSKGLYILKLTDKSGHQQSMKIEKY